MARRPRPQRPSDSGRVIFTIASANYLAHAATLMQTVRARHPEATRVIVLADAPRPFEAIDLAAELLPCDSLDIELIENMRLWYTCIEFNTAIKPYAFRHFFANGAQEAVYLDPDIQLFAPLDEAFRALLDHSIVLTPHITQPLQDGQQPDDLAILKSGVYNLGFLGVRNDEEAGRLLEWWSQRTFLHCRVDVTENLFTDQRWMDLAPAFLSKPYILRDPGYNVAYWNVAHRAVQTPMPGQWTVDGRPLVFFHYSGLQADDPEIFSRYQTRFEMSDLGDVANLCEAYRERLMDNSWAVSTLYPYAYGRFANGRPIEDPMRRWLLRAVDEERLDPKLPLDLDSEFFDEVDETAAARGIAMTRLMHQLWLDRPDLRSVFDIYTPRGLDAFLAWFTGGDAEVDGRSIAAASLLHDGLGRDDGTLVRSGAQPWESVAAEHWAGPASQADNLLQGDLWAHIGAHDLLLPRQAALLWELRRDLQDGYPLHNLDRANDFIGWAITAGVLESGIDPEFFSDAFIAQEAALSQIASRYDDVPITEAMRATRRVVLRREYLNFWEKFPQQREGRLSHGLWFAYVAPTFCDWPAELVAPVRAWFEVLTDKSCGDFVFNRAELALWELRDDLQKIFPLTDRHSCWGFLNWICGEGLHELQLQLDDFDPRLRVFLSAPSSTMFGFSGLGEMLYEARADLRAAFDIETDPGRAGLQHWIEHHFVEAYGTYPVSVVRALRAAADQPAEPYRITLALVGQWLAPSGRGEDLRGSARALDEVGFTEYVIVDRDSGDVIKPSGEILPSDIPLVADTAIVHLNAETALQDWEFLRARQVSAGKTIGFWAWELDRLPAAWRHAYSFYDALWASTTFARGAFAREGLRPVSLMPMTVSVPNVTRERPRLRVQTVFFFMFDFRSFVSRKNPEGVVQAFLQAFPEGDEKVRLIIKTQAGSGAATAWRRLNALCSDPRIELRDVTVDRAALIAMIAEADVFVSLHRSEGFGRGPAEAMLLERPVIATGYSGTTDFIAADCAYVVSYTLRPVLVDEYPGVDRQSWAEPDIGEAAAFMRRCHENPKEASALGRRGCARVEDLYNARRVGTAMLEELGLAAPETPGRAAAGRFAPKRR